MSQVSTVRGPVDVAGFYHRGPRRLLGQTR
jgi:hypothetical protein